jgi:sugar lactone lactonase YvrE
VISSTDLRNPAGIAFDQTGNLWVVNFHSSTAGNSHASIVRFNNVQGLSGNQTLSASLVINPPATGTVANYFGLVHNLAFSASGDLYVGGPSTIMRFINPQNLTGTIVRNPDGVILADGYGAQVGFSGMLAFDAGGNLWVSGDEGSAPSVSFLMKFANPVFAGVSSPPPNVRLTLGNSRTPNGMAFDDEGSLWLIQDGSGSRSIVKFTNPGSLGNGNATPSISLRNTTFSGIGKLAFFPTPLGLPLY